MPNSTTMLSRLIGGVGQHEHSRNSAAGRRDVEDQLALPEVAEHALHGTGRSVAVARSRPEIIRPMYLPARCHLLHVSSGTAWQLLPSREKDSARNRREVAEVLLQNADESPIGVQLLEADDVGGVARPVALMVLAFIFGDDSPVAKDEVAEAQRSPQAGR